MPLSEQKYRDLGIMLNENLAVGRAAVKEAWALIKPILVRNYVEHGVDPDRFAAAR